MKPSAMILLAIATGALCTPARSAIPPLSTIVEIPEGSDPAQIAGLASLQSDSLARVAKWPWTMPSGNASGITKSDYIAAVESYPGLAYYIDRYATGSNLSPGIFYEALPVFIAMYKKTGDSTYLDYVVAGTARFSQSIDDEILALGNGTPDYSSYWHADYALMYEEFMLIQDTAQGVAAMNDFAAALGRKADAWGTATAAKGGVYNMTIDPAFWFDLALRYNPNLKRRAELQQYVDTVWNEFWQTKDYSEDDSHYSFSDLMVFNAWYRLRGLNWEESAETSNIFTSFAHQIGNDGTLPAFGDGKNLGEWFHAAAIAELVASKTKDPEAKWLAHRAFWAGEDHLAGFSAGIGYANSMYLAMAYLFADDTVREDAPPAGVTVLHRHWRDLEPGATRYYSGRWFKLRDDLASSKTLIRTGPQEASPFVFIQSGQQGGHGHPDASAIVHYGSDFSYNLFAGELRLDRWSEESNVFLLRQPNTAVPWAGSFESLVTTEDVSVPVTSHTASGGYARIHVQEDRGVVPTTESFAAVTHMVEQALYAPEKAIGYKNWPVRLDRSVLLLERDILVVRDLTEHVVGVPARMGQNWTFGELGEVGSNWINTWSRKDLSARFGYRFASGTLQALMHPAPKDLLIWFAPQDTASLEIEKLGYSRYEAAPAGVVLPSDPHWPSDPNDQHLEYLNSPFRAWYARSSNWLPNSRQVSTTIMVPHDPHTSASSIAERISLLADAPPLTAIKMQGEDEGSYQVIILHDAGGSLPFAGLSTNAEAATITFAGGLAKQVSLWNATFAAFNGVRFLTTSTPVDIDATCAGETAASVRCSGEFLFTNGFD